MSPDDPRPAGHALRCCRTCGAVFRPVGKARYCSEECRHGTDAGYNAGCREACCRRAHARARKRDRCVPNPHVPPLGTVRRVRALARLGWSSSELSRRLGHDRTYLAKVLTEAKIEATTALKVAELYADLSMTWCTSPTARRTADEARAKGWPPPLAWDRIDDPTRSRPAGSTPHRLAWRFSSTSTSREPGSARSVTASACRGTRCRSGARTTASLPCSSASVTARSGP